MKRFFTFITATALTAAAFAAQPGGQGSVPVMYITTTGGTMPVDKEDKVAATMYIDPNGSSYEALGTAAEPVSFTLSGRGNYTWTGFDKKPYKLKFDKKTSVFGLPKDKTWAILAHADDDSGFMRNTGGFEISRQLGLAWTPNQVPVEVVFNGNYHGLYFLTETVKVNEGRVNITEQADLETNPDAITGGWLVEIDNYDTDPHVTVTEGGGWDYPIWFTYKSPEALSPAQEEWLTAQMQKINDLIYGDKNSTELWDYLDLDAAVRFYLVQEIMDDTESYHGSCYLHRDLGEGAKWTFGPVWDFGNAFHRWNKGNFIYDRPTFHQVWIGELAKFPAFKEKLDEAWNQFYAEVYPTLPAFISDFTKQVSGAAAADAQRWPQYGQSNISEANNNFAYLLDQSVNWLKSKWGVKQPEGQQDIYLRGEFNNWGTSHKFNTEDGKTYTLTVQNLTGSWKIATEDWKTVDFGGYEGQETLAANQTHTLKPVGVNLKMEYDMPTAYFTFNLPEGTLTVSDQSTVVGGIADNGLSIAGRDVTSASPMEIYSISGQTVASGVTRATLEPGIYIIVAGKEKIKAAVR